MQVHDLVTRDVITFHRDDPLETLVNALGESPQDVFPVIDSAEKVVGTVSEQDLIRVLSPTERIFAFGSSKLIREGLVRDIEDIMTPRPSTARPDEPIEAALRRMSELHLPQLVVVDPQGKLVGLLRGRDVYRALFRAKR